MGDIIDSKHEIEDVQNGINEIQEGAAKGLDHMQKLKLRDDHLTSKLQKLVEELRAAVKVQNNLSDEYDIEKAKMEVLEKRMEGQRMQLLQAREKSEQTVQLLFEAHDTLVADTIKYEASMSKIAAKFRNASKSYDNASLQNEVDLLKNDSDELEERLRAISLNINTLRHEYTPLRTDTMHALGEVTRDSVVIHVKHINHLKECAKILKKQNDKISMDIDKAEKLKDSLLTK